MVRGVLFSRNHQQVVKWRPVWWNFWTSGQEVGVNEASEGGRLKHEGWWTQGSWPKGAMTCMYVWPQTFSLEHTVASLPHQAGSGHVSLGGSRCLRTSALVAIALCWRADFLSTRNLILVLCAFASTRTLLLEASCVQGAGCWLRWWHERESDKICITSGSFISKGLFAAVVSKWNGAASSLACDREHLCHGGTASGFPCKFTPNDGEVTLGCFLEAEVWLYCWEFRKRNIIETRLKWHHSFLFHKHALHVWTVCRCFALITCCVGLWPRNVDN